MSRFIKFFLSLIIIVSGNTSITAKTDTKVWNHPVAERNYNNHDGYFHPTVNVTNVEIKPDETILHMAVSYRPQFSFKISSKSCITIGNDTLTVKNANNIELDSATFCQYDTERRFALIFPSLPAETAKFDFHSGNHINILGISDVSYIEKRLIPSNWRNESTGDWEIGFYNEGVIYDCGFWNYVGEKRPDNSDKFEITDGNRTMIVKTGKLKNGKRNIKIGDRSITCSMITGRTLPPYPVKDESASFKNNGYAGGDTAVITGWLKDLPEGLRKKSEYYSVSYNDIFTDNDIEATCKLDSIGRFTIKIPVINSTGCFMDWDKTYIRTCIEPGETYFLFYDFGRGQKLFMGKNCRLQNELLAHPLTWNYLSMGYDFKSNDYDEYLMAIDKLLNRQTEALDSLCSAVPTLSQRFYIYQKDHLRNTHAREMGQSRFKNKQLQLPENMANYIRDNFWQSTTSPYSLHQETKRLIYDYIHDYLLKHPVKASITSDYIIKNMDKLGFSDDERVILEKWGKAQREYEQALANVTDTAERKLMSERYMSENAELFDEAQTMLNSEKNSNMIMSELALMTMTEEFALLDSLNANAETRNIWLAQKGFDLVDSRRQPLTPGMIRFLKENITIESALERIMQENRIYVDLEKKINSNMTQKPLATDDISDSDDGETILQKIIAPHKGKIILLDIWGTWCAPCREALSESQEEYTKLKDYDIVYIYLANNSPEASWRNVIEQYNVKGDNCFHYNLPQNQQAAVEAYLKVREFPTYKLFDRNGNLLQVNADPRDLDKFKSLIDRLVK